MTGIRGVVRNLKAADGFRQNVQNTADHIKENPADIGGHVQNIRANVNDYQNLAPGAKGVVNRAVQKKLGQAMQPENIGQALGQGLAKGIGTGSQQLGKAVAGGFKALLSGGNQDATGPPE